MTTAEQLLKSVITRIATGPDLSKDIEFSEAKSAMQAIIRGRIDPVQSAIFLIALRMKRETMDENKGILAAILAESEQQNAQVDTVVDIGDPYNGYGRSIPISSFLPPLLAELGLPCVIHGLDSITPKFGLTHHHIYQHLGLDVGLAATLVKARIEDKKLGWGYIDQSQYCQGLYALLPLRNKIVKRTVINTVETLVGPIRGKKTHLVLGYVHKPYPPIYAQLACASGLNSSLLLRGIEGGVVPSLRQTALMIAYDGAVERHRVDIDPEKLGIKRDIRAIAFPQGLGTENNKDELAKWTIELGTQALSGKAGVYYDGLVYVASLVLWHTQKARSMVEAAGMVRAVLDSGCAQSRLL